MKCTFCHRECDSLITPQDGAAGGVCPDCDRHPSSDDADRSLGAVVFVAVCCGLPVLGSVWIIAHMLGM